MQSSFNSSSWLAHSYSSLSPERLVEAKEEKVEVHVAHMNSEEVNLNGPTTCNDADVSHTLWSEVDQCNLTLTSNKVTTSNNNTQGKKKLNCTALYDDQKSSSISWKILHSANHL